VELVYNFFGRRRDLEELFYRAVVSEGLSSDAYRQLREDRVEEIWPRLRALVNSLLGSILESDRQRKYITAERSHNIGSREVYLLSGV